MKKILLYIALVVFGVTGCITNDLPYPVVVPHILSLDVPGAENVDVDFEACKVTISLPETADLRTVKIQDVTFDNENVTSSYELLGVHDLRNPLTFKLSLYDEFDWVIEAVREIERYFTVDGQVGSSVIDHVNHRVIAMVGKNVKLDEIIVTSLKLGPEGITVYSKTPSQMTDFTHGVEVEVTAFGETHTWTLYIENTEQSVEITKVDPWAHQAYVTLTGMSGVENIFKYRVKGSAEWVIVASSDVTSDGGTFIAHIKGLQSYTNYEVTAYCGNEQAPVVEFTTESAVALPNGSFEYASKVAGSSYYKFYDPSCGIEEGMSMFWGSGNGEGSEGVNGSANLGVIITFIDTAEKVDGNQSVRAQTTQMAGMLAAGNLFTGQFAGLVGTSGGKVNFGRPWTTRPSALKLHCKYRTGKIDILKNMPAGVALTKEDYDRAEIKFALGTWSHRTYGGTAVSPVHINTTDASTFVDFTTDASTIAYGNLVIHHDGFVINGGEKETCNTETWIEYTIPLDYHKMSTQPTHIIISCAASRYGDYFTGYSNSTLWIDDVELIY